VVHIFKSSEREYYQLERLWSDAQLTNYNDWNQTIY
jgi:ribosomal silencing factor RsfS